MCHQGGEVAAVFAVGGFEAVGDIVDVDIAVGVFHHGSHDALLDGLVVVLIELGGLVAQLGQQGVALVGVVLIADGFDGAAEEGGLVEQFGAFQQPFVEIGDGFLQFAAVGIALLDEAQGGTVFGVLVQRPVVVLLLHLFFQGHGVEFLEGDVLLVAVFPVVGAAGIFGGVFNLDGLVLVHLLAEDVDFHGAQFVAEFVGDFHGLFQAIGSEEVVGGAGEAEDHGEVAVLQLAGADGEVVLGLEGDVLLGVGCGLAVGGGVDAEHGKVAGVAGP